MRLLVGDVLIMDSIINKHFIYVMNSTYEPSTECHRVVFVDDAFTKVAERLKEVFTPSFSTAQQDAMVVPYQSAKAVLPVI